MNFKSHCFVTVSVIVAMAIVSCSTPKKTLYFQNIDEITLKKLENNYEAVIKKDDRLSIFVSGPDRSVTSPYNLSSYESTDLTGTSSDGGASSCYLVDPYGDISFPILGKIHVEGMTRNQLVEYLTREIGKDVKDPIVHISFKNYKVTVLGEVDEPGTYTFDTEKNNLLQALSLAGDLKITAKRDGILLIREVDGKMIHYTIDLKDSHLLDSPYFFLQQNDIIYVPPSTLGVYSGTAATNIWSITLSSVTAILALLAILLR